MFVVSSSYSEEYTIVSHCFLQICLLWCVQCTCISWSPFGINVGLVLVTRNTHCYTQYKTETDAYTTNYYTPVAIHFLWLLGNYDVTYCVIMRKSRALTELFWDQKICRNVDLLIRGESEWAPNSGVTYGKFAVPTYACMYVRMYVCVYVCSNTSSMCSSHCMHAQCESALH